MVRHVPRLCRDGICSKLMGLRRNRVDPLEDQVQLEVINQGNVLITDVKIQALLVLFLFFFFSFWQDTIPRQDGSLAIGK